MSKDLVSSDPPYAMTPYFTVRDADRLIAFVSTVFGGIVVKENRYEDGTVQHVRIRIGDSLLMLNQSTAEYRPNVSQMHLYVDDVETTYAVALAHGGTSLMEPNKRPHGDWMAGITDPCQNIWWIAQPDG
ncbi:VOC family protein [Coralliovum pocilloporae]|uniref:VOC family protein n=1 Tax=Coralliovum pocilloporae TaxID=3066369 RepID=UPI0033072167